MRDTIQVARDGDQFRAGDAILSIEPWRRTWIKVPRLIVREEDSERERTVFVGERIAKGSFGVVHHGRILDGDRQDDFAIKIMRRGLPSSRLDELAPHTPWVVIHNETDAYRRLARWAGAPQGPIDIPYIAQVRNIVWSRQSVAIIMPCYPRSLADLYDGPIPRSDVVRYSLQLAKAVQFLQSLDMVHRDLKPSNILIDTQDSIRLIDFGLAVTDVSYHTPGPAGTKSYMAPEIMRKRAIGQCDVWSLGAIMYEMLVGEQIVSAHGRSPDLHSKNQMSMLAESRIDGPLGRLVAGMLESNPSRRVRIDAVIRSLQDLQ